MSGTRPIGIADLLRPISAIDAECPPHPAMGDHWYWCRRHEQAVRSDGHCDCTCRGKDDWHNRPPGSVFHDGSCPQHPHNADCIRVGPFMSEIEAGRLHGDDGMQTHWGPLGMEIEQ